MPKQNQQTSPAENQAIKDAKMELFEGISELDDHDLEALRGFLRIINANRGNASTPIEDFITVLPHLWENAEKTGFSLTPDDIINMIEAPSDGAREYFDEAVAITRDFNARYSRIVTAKAEGEEV